MGREREVRKQPETVQMTAAKNIPGCSSTTSNTVSRAELGMYPLKTYRDERTLNGNKVKNMPEKRLPVVSDRAVWEKITRGREQDGITESRKYGRI